MVIILDGRKAADIIMNEVKSRVQTLKSQSDSEPF